ncbi:MAG: threonylcarbamoyl-AMP synthase [Candidatus Heimdallarchaeota archaeon]|nr:threonylcarbamoyl-AMP synthase [Candidatus Heimdallarchaeota archaeon]
MRISILDENSLENIASHLRKGGIGVYPTDTVYGLGTLALKSNDLQIMKIYQIKRRSFEKPLSLLITNEMINKYIEARSDILAFLNKNWPGKLTVILRRKKNEIYPLSDLLNYKNPDKIAFRVPDNENLLKIIDLIGYPIIGTSANLSGTKSKLDLDSVLKELDSKDITLWVDGGRLPPTPPSTILDFTNPNEPRVVRTGSGNIKGFKNHFTP